jgi:hypothetical protein
MARNMAIDYGMPVAFVFIRMASTINYAFDHLKLDCPQRNYAVN